MLVGWEEANSIYFIEGCSTICEGCRHGGPMAWRARAPAQAPAECTGATCFIEVRWAKKFSELLAAQLKLSPCVCSLQHRGIQRAC